MCTHLLVIVSRRVFLKFKALFTSKACIEKKVYFKLSLSYFSRKKAINAQ